MTIALLVAALLMGFFGSPHCLGMCGGLVAAFGLSMKEVSPTKRRGLIATYHVGRLLSYASLGLLAGVIGTTVLEPMMMGNNIPRILLGLVLVFVGMVMLGAPFLNKLERLGMRFWQVLTPLRKKVFPLTTFPRALTAGLLWGFLPCGLVYGALLIAVVGHDPLTGAVLMFTFGLGTVPMLVATHSTVNWLRTLIGRWRLRQMNGAIMMISGLAVIVVPIAMSSMHGGHSGHSAGMPMDHSAHSAMMTETDVSHQTDMSHMNHDMTPNAHAGMNHGMEQGMDEMPSEHHMNDQNSVTEHTHH